MIISSWEMMLGSSPLARGLLHDHLLVGDDAGIIPARAGFTADTIVKDGAV